ncbi:unnamed protein product [Urochloa humidicola]
MLDTSFMTLKLDYAGTKDLAAGEFVIHAGILAGGHTWMVAAQPRGGLSEDNNGEYLAMYALTMDKPSIAIDAIFHALVIGRDGAPSSSFSRARRSPPGLSWDGRSS